MTRSFVLVAAGLIGSWQPVAPGVWSRELKLAERGVLSAVSVIAIRIDPARVEFALDSATRDYGTRGAWSIERLPPQALVGVNTGQFIGGLTWGWVVHQGIESSPPGTGSVSMSFAVDSSGRPSLLSPDEMPAARGHVRLAFQSYPALLTGNGVVPRELQASGRGVDLDHRDSRLAICMHRDGSVVLALTRFAAFGSGAETLPWGPTVVEMAEFMRSLGCRRAMLLDGGISSQLSVRQSDGTVRQWSNWRKVPLGLVVLPRAATASTP